MTTSNKSLVLKDVIAYVDIWSADKTANYSKPFVQQLEQMGAMVSKTFNKEVTHVVFNNGHSATWRKAKKNNVCLVSLLWISGCHDEGVRVNEELFPALNDESNPVMKNKKHRCMRPKDSVDKTPDSDKRMRKKLDKMLTVLTPKESVCTDVSSVFIDEENGIVYSPSLKRADYMARRLKDMKEKRENLSPTASQMMESGSPPTLKTSLGSMPEVLNLMFDNPDEDSSATKPDYSASKEDGRKYLDQDKKCLERLVTRSSTNPSLSPCRDLSENTLDQTKCHDVGEKKGYTKSRRTSVRGKPQNKPVLESPCQDRRSNIRNDLIKETRSRMKSSDRLLNSSDKQKNVAAESFTETAVCFYAKPGKASSCPPLSTLLDGSAAETSKETAALLQRGEQKTQKRASSSFSAQLQCFSKSNESKEANAASINGDVDVFEDYFSSANHRQRSKEACLPHLSVGKSIHIPFDLAPVQKKRKQRKSETLEFESLDNKRRKLGKSQSGTERWLEIHQEDFQKNLSSQCSLRAIGSPMAQTPQQSPLGSKVTSNPTDETLKLQRESTSEQSTLLQEEKAVSILLSNVLESRNESTVSPGFSEIPSDAEHIHECKDNLSPQKMTHKSKAMRTLVMTSMPAEKQNIVFQVVKALGSFLLVDKVCESTTHVVSGTHKRTLNIMLGIARGCWILSFEWILWCLEQRQWVSEEPYELSDQFPAAQICRLQRHLSAGEHQQDLFQGQPAMFVSQHSQPPTQSLVELIELCGGTVSKTVRQAGICIGQYNGRRPEGSRILSEQWVLDCITHLKQLSYDTYDLE